MKLRTLLAFGLTATLVWTARASSREDDSLGKEILATAPSRAAFGELLLAQAEASPTETPPRATRGSRTQYFEPVRPITPPPGARTRPTRSRSSERKATPEPTSLPEIASPSETVSGSPSKKASPTTTITATEVVNYESYPAGVRGILDLGFDLTSRNLTYKYNSAEPDRGGMDCSGFVYYVLGKAGIKDVPRDARDQYVWTRKAGTFQAVLSQRDDTVELEGLKPSDLLFWGHAGGTNRDPDVTETMIYLGRENGTNQRLMVGASDTRDARGPQKTGVGVFDFKVARARKTDGEPGPVFVGYARIPGLALE